MDCNQSVRPDDDEIVRINARCFDPSFPELNAVGEAVESGGGMSGDIDMGDDEDDMDMDLGDDDMDSSRWCWHRRCRRRRRRNSSGCPTSSKKDRPSIGEKYTTARAKGKVYKKREKERKSLSQEIHALWCRRFLRKEHNNQHGPRIKRLSTLATEFLNQKILLTRMTRTLQANQELKALQNLSQRLRIWRRLEMKAKHNKKRNTAFIFEA